MNYPQCPTPPHISGLKSHMAEQLHSIFLVFKGFKQILAPVLLLKDKIIFWLHAVVQVKTR